MFGYKFPDEYAIRLGSQYTEQAVGWGDGTCVCALHAAVIAATARDYM